MFGNDKIHEITKKKGRENMQFDFLDKIQAKSDQKIENIKEKQELNVKNSNITQTEIELAKKLDAIEEFSVDRFEGDIAILENRKDGNKIEVNKNDLPEDLRSGDIIKKINGKYFLDDQKTIEESERIRNRMNNLWN